jgi:molybdate transport system substrate-binding protein
VKRLLSAMMLVALTLAVTSARAQTEVTLLAPGITPTKGALEKVIPAFESKTGYKVKITYGSGLGTKEQVAKGQPLDVSVFFAPAPEALASPTIAKSSAKTIARLVMAVVVKKGAAKPDISTPAAVKRTLLAVNSIDIVDPKTGSAGWGAMETLKKLGIEEQMQPKIKLVRGGNISQQDVAKGNIDMCLLYLGDVESPGVDVVGPLPAKASVLTDVVGVISAKPSDPKAAKALLDYLASPEAAAVYKTTGLQPAH